MASELMLNKLSKKVFRGEEKPMNKNLLTLTIQIFCFEERGAQWMQITILRLILTRNVIAIAVHKRIIIG